MTAFIFIKGGDLDP